MNCYKADPVSRADIRRYVYMLKKKVGLEEELYFPILPFVENVLPMLIPDFQFQVVPVAEMGVKHGETYPSKNLIRIRIPVRNLNRMRIRNGRQMLLVENCLHPPI